MARSIYAPVNWIFNHQGAQAGPAPIFQTIEEMKMNSLKKRSFVHWLIFLVLIAALLAGCTAPAVPANTSPAAGTQPTRL